jgi:plastocyanin
MFQRLLLGLVAVAALTLTAAACGGGDEDDDNGGNGGPTATTASTTPGDDNGDNGGDGGPVSFDISLRDNFFEPKEFTFSEGAEATFNITNAGTAIHNMRIAGADNEFNTDDDAISDQIIAAGATSTVEWTAPDESGTYDFQCDYHLPDMAGTITVE